MRAVQWLDDGERQAWLALLRGSTLLLDRLDSELTAAHGLSLGDYEILVNIAASGADGLRLADLADRVQFSRSRLTYRLNRLEHDRMVERIACPTDGRGAFAVLTEHGRARLDEAAPTHVEGIRRHLVDQLDRDDLDHLARVLGKVLEGLGDRFEPPTLAALRCEGR